MLYIQENRSVNTTRAFRTHTLAEALDSTSPHMQL